MFSNEERIEVAAKLREKKEDFFGVRSFFPQDLILYQSLYLKAIEECLPDGDCCFDVLAGLIDVPTAKGIIEDDGTSVCGHCGFRFDVSVETAGCFSEVVLANHCPQCGRLLVWCDEVDE